jgi:hypothetical protein
MTSWILVATFYYHSLVLDMSSKDTCIAARASLIALHKDAQQQPTIVCLRR